MRRIKQCPCCWCGPRDCGGGMCRRFERWFRMSWRKLQNAYIGRPMPTKEEWFGCGKN